MTKLKPKSAQSSFVKIRFILILISTVNFITKSVYAIESCPMEPLKAIIERSIEIADADAMLQMQIIRRIIEDVYGGSWGVLIVKDLSLISSVVHWTIPDIRNVRKPKSTEEGIDAQLPAFCLHVSTTTNWQYNVFRAGTLDVSNRLTVENIVKKLRRNQISEKTQFDSQILQLVKKLQQGN